MRAIYEGGNDCGEIDMADTRINDRTMRALRQRKLVWTDLRRERYELTQLGWIVGGEVMYGRGWEPPI